MASLGTIEPSAALQAILSAAPAKIFVAAGDMCSVCLDDFTDTVTQAALALPTPEARKVLQKATPPVVALRCGHCLHIACAEQAVAAALARHVRCPLCREPVTVSGAVSARCFG